MMGGPEQDVAPSFTTIDVNGKTVENFDPFNRAGGITQLTPDQTDMAVVKINIIPIELNELHIKPYDAVVSVNITYDDNTIQTEVCTYFYNNLYIDIKWTSFYKRKSQ